MPELPEVETVRKGLEKKLKKFHIERLEVLSQRTIASFGGSDFFKKKITGSYFGEWTRRGKYLICKLESNLERNCSGWLVVHLRMTGQFQFLTKQEPSCPYTRIRFWNKEKVELRYVDTRNFGQMWWIEPENHPTNKIKGLISIGPEPFSKEFNSSYLKNSLKNRKRSIKSSLLDQSTVAGAGNIYADESLFEAGIIPSKESRKLDNQEISKLCLALSNVLKKSIGKGGTTFKDFRDLEGINGNYGGQAWVYGRANKACKICGSIILKCKISGRGTHWCPKCQK